MIEIKLIIGVAALFFALYRAIFMMLPLLLEAKTITEFFHAFVLIA